MSAASRNDDLFAQLRDSCTGEWGDYTGHAFVRGIGDGTLPEPAFKHYLAQDYLFLIHFARAYGLAAFKSMKLDDIRQAAAGLSAIVDTEMGLHVEFCRGWGMSEADMATVPEAEETMAYTRYVLEKGLQGDLLDLHVALAPCMVGYGEIGKALDEDPATKRTGNPYLPWIEMYASAEFQEAAHAERTVMDRLMAERGGPGRLEELAETFRQATRLESAFWQMGLDAA